MAEFLTRKGIVHHVDRIIADAEEEVILISPYIKADDDTKDLLKHKGRGTSIHVLYGKTELGPDEKEFFHELGIETLFIKHLHAKCYLNERHALVTSMNLYEFSQVHNDEMGVLVSREDDPDLYEDIYDQAIRWKTGASTIGKASSRKKIPARGGSSSSKRKVGFCIRCKAALAANPEQPYCKTCYTAWEKYGNKSHKERCCHTCGRGFRATLLKPLCLDCYKKYKDFVKFAAG